MYRKMHPGKPLPEYLAGGHQKREELAHLADIMQKLRDSGVDVDDHAELADRLSPTLLDHVRQRSGGGAPETPASQLRELRRQMLASNPELYKQLGLQDDKQGFSHAVEDLQYSSDLVAGMLANKSQADGKLSNRSAFGGTSHLRDAVTKNAVKSHVLPYFSNSMEKKMNRKFKSIAFARIKQQHHTRPKQGKSFMRVGDLMQSADKRLFFSVMREKLRDEEYLDKKMAEFYRSNLLRIMLGCLKNHAKFQQAWIEQARDSIKKTVVIDVMRRNCYLNKMEDKASMFYASRLFTAWKRATAADRLQTDALVSEFRDICAARLLEDVVRELRCNMLASKQERKRDMEAVQQYQKVKIFRVFEYWKALISKRRTAVDFARYKGMAAIPVRVTQKRNLELLDGDVSKVVAYRHLSTSYKLMHPATKI